MIFDKLKAPAQTIGQYNQPEPEAVRRYFSEIFERQYYTESGPLVRRLETQIGHLLGVSHVVCVSNPTVAWLMLLEAANLVKGDLLLPVTAPKHVIQAIHWMGCSHRIHDVSWIHGFRSHRSDVEAGSVNNIGALIGVNSWGGACDLDGLSDWAKERGIPFFLDSSESFACRIEEQLIGTWGTAEVFSFEKKNLINGAGCACICTQDEVLADRLRCMRSSGGVVRQVPVSKTVNGRMSEAQAAFVLMSLERADYWIDRNKEQHKLYSEKLSKLPGLQILSAQGVSASNYQQIVIATHAINLRTMLSCCLLDNGWQFSALEGLAVKGNMDYASGTDALDLATITLPLGYEVDTKTIDRICAAISLCLGHDSQSRK